MRVVALEEHFTVPAVASKYVKPDAIAKRGHYKGRKVAPGKASPMELLPEFGEKRFKSMDDAGITVQVLSNSGPGPDLVPGADGVALAQRGQRLSGRRRHQASEALRRLRRRCRWQAPTPAPPSCGAR